MALAENHHTGLWEPVRRHPRLAAAGVLLLLSVLFFWKLAATNEYMWMDSPDLANQVLPWWNHQAREWHAGRFPAWEPDQWAGQPLIGQAQPGAAYPLNWLLFLTPLKDGKLRQGYLDGYWILVHYIAALNAFLLCWGLGRSWLAALLAGCVYGFLGYVGNINWPQMVNGAIWAPLVFLFLIRAVRGQRTLFSAAASGFFLGLSWLSGHHQVPTFVTYASLALWTYFFFRGGKPRWALALPIALFLVFFVGTSALQTLPSYEYAKLAKRWVGAREAVDWRTPVPYSVHATYSFRPVFLLGLFLPNFSEGYTGFVGVTALTLALASLLAWSRAPWVRRFTMMAGAALVVALGFYTPFHGWLYAWAPLFEKARSPAAAVAVFNLAAAVLVAFGFDELRRGGPVAPLRLGRRILLAFGSLLAAIYLVTNLVKGNGSIGDDRALTTGIIAGIVAGLLLAAERRAITVTVLAAGLLALILTEGNHTSTYGYISKDVVRTDGSLPKTWEHDDLAAFLRSEPQPIRVWVDDKAIAYNFGDFHGIRAWGGYLASLSVNILAIDANQEKIQRALGITHHLGKVPMNAAQTEAFAGSSGVKVFRNPNPSPPVWTVKTVFPVRTGEEANIMLQGDLDLRQHAFSIGPPPKIALPAKSCGEDRVRLTRSHGGHVEIAAQMSCEGLVVLGDVYFPGWGASIDGRPAAVHEINGLMRGVVVPGGKHQVTMDYRPWSLQVGAALTGLSCLGLLALAVFGPRGNSDHQLGEEDVEGINEIP